MKGILRRYNPAAGFGFVRCDDGIEAYLNVSEAHGVRLRPGVRLEFDREPAIDGKRWPACVNVSATGRDARPEQNGPQRGFVQKYNTHKKFGWIKPAEGGRDLFFLHSRSQLGGEVVAGGLVEYEIAADDQGRDMAINCRHIRPDNPVDVVED